MKTQRVQVVGSAISGLDPTAITLFLVNPNRRQAFGRVAMDMVAQAYKHSHQGEKAVETALGRSVTPGWHGWKGEGCLMMMIRKRFYGLMRISRTREGVEEVLWGMMWSVVVSFGSGLEGGRETFVRVS